MKSHNGRPKCDLYSILIGLYDWSSGINLSQTLKFKISCKSIFTMSVSRRFNCDYQMKRNNNIMWIFLTKNSRSWSFVISLSFCRRQYSYLLHFKSRTKLKHLFSLCCSTGKHHSLFELNARQCTECRLNFLPFGFLLYFTYRFEWYKNGACAPKSLHKSGCFWKLFKIVLNNSITFIVWI